MRAQDTSKFKLLAAAFDTRFQWPADESSGSTRFVNDVVVADVLSKNMGLAPASCSCDASDGGIMLLFGIAPRSGVDAGA